MSLTVRPSDKARPWAWVRVSRDRAETFVALAAFAVLCIVVLSSVSRLVEPDDYAYRASIVAITQGYFLRCTTQADRLAAQLPGPVAGVPGVLQWVQLPGGRWISEKDPGYPFLAAPFQAAGIIRLAPLFYGALGCLGLFFGARRWLGRYGGPAAVVLFCSSGAALLFAWRDYMPTFTDAALIAAGTGALLWAVLAAEATARRRTWTGLAGFADLEAAVSVRYTDIVVLGCAVVAVVAAWKLRAVPAAALGWWLGSVAVSGAGLALYDDLVYGGPLTLRVPPRRDHLQPPRGTAQPAEDACLPDPGHAHAGARPGGAGMDRRTAGQAAPCRMTSEPRPPAATWPWGWPWPWSGSACGLCMPPTPGQPTPSAPPCSSPGSTSPPRAPSRCSAAGWSLACHAGHHWRR